MKRWKIFNELLCRPEGASYNEYQDALESIDSFDHSCMAHDKKEINELLLANNLPKLIESGTSKNKRFRMADTGIDICSLKQNRRPSKFYRELIDMLSHSVGVVSDEWLTEMKVKLEEADRDWSEQGIVMDFEQHADVDQIEFLSNFFRAIRKKNVLKLRVKPLNRQEYTVIFHPEYLKQYKGLWYVFGLSGQEDKSEDLSFSKFQIGLVTDEPSILKTKFQSSGVDYDDYFSEIIGVDNYSGQQIKMIKILVKSRMAKRFEQNSPFSTVLTRQSKSDEPGFVCFSLSLKINKALKRILYSYGSDIKIVSPPE